MIQNEQLSRQVEPTRRILAAVAALTVICVFFVLPLWAALLICSMPCCDHGGSDLAAISEAAATGCETECGIRADEAEPADVAAVVAERVVQGTAPLTAALVDLPPPAVPTIDHGRGAAHRAADAPLHVLNSVFRI